MARYSFPALIQPWNGTFHVSFPDLPNCWSVGPNVDAAVQNANDALYTHLIDHYASGRPIPVPMPYGDRMMLGAPPGSIWSLVSVELSDTSERINVYLPSTLLGKIDRLATSQGASRSSFIAIALNAYADALDERLRARQVGQLVSTQFTQNEDLMVKAAIGNGAVVVDEFGRVLGLGNITQTLDGKMIVVTHQGGAPPILQPSRQMG